MIASNIQKQISVFAKEYASQTETLFILEVDRGIHRFNITSPIEQLLYAAMLKTKSMYGLNDLAISPQKKFGKYFVDFLIEEDKPVIVECDSQTFHDRTEVERRYEKSRDRFLQKQGIHVFRYTGKEIIENPTKIAEEILEYTSGIVTAFF